MKSIKNKDKINQIILVAVIILIFIILAYLYIKYSSNEPYPEDLYLTENTVIRIIDGDTFELFSGEVIRLICVDTPEKGEEGYEEASDFLFSLVYLEEVRLEKDIDDQDRYGRLLRYVYISDNETEIFVNKEIIQNNYGELFKYENNTAKCGEIAN